MGHPQQSQDHYGSCAILKVPVNIFEGFETPVTLLYLSIMKLTLVKIPLVSCNTGSSYGDLQHRMLATILERTF